MPTTLTTPGIFHTAFGVAALICGLIALMQDRQILLKNRFAQIYLVATLLTAAIALCIFQHGSFGPPHALAVLTLLALAAGTVAATSTFFKGLSRYVQAIGYSATFLFQIIAGITESSTRLPPGAPLVASQEAPVFKGIYFALLVVFLIGATMQVRWLRATPRP